MFNDFFRKNLHAAFSNSTVNVMLLKILRINYFLNKKLDII